MFHDFDESIFAKIDLHGIPMLFTKTAPLFLPSLLCISKTISIQIADLEPNFMVKGKGKSISFSSVKPLNLPSKGKYYGNESRDLYPYIVLKATQTNPWSLFHSLLNLLLPLLSRIDSWYIYIYISSFN